ncbi:MAG: signal peptidase I [Clostridia bacterium]|nr:signal peptidase I [Clostridia bacterium]
MSKLANIFSKKEKKELTPKQQKTRTILNWVVNIVSIIIIVFALVVAILTIVRVSNKNKVTSLFGNVYMTVLTDSMEPTFNAGDVLIANEYNGDGRDLKVGQVITFKRTINGYESFNTHRILKIEASATGVRIRTRGDNQYDANGNWLDWHDYVDNQENANLDIHPIYNMEDIVAVWGDVSEDGSGNIVFTPGKRLKGAGFLSKWLQENPEKQQTRFFLIIVLPLIVLFVAYAFILVRALINAKVEKEKAVQADTTVTVDSLSDEEKRRLAEEYLASLKQQAEASSQDSQPEEAHDAPLEEPVGPQEATEAPKVDEPNEDSPETL